MPIGDIETGSAGVSSVIFENRDLTGTANCTTYGNAAIWRFSDQNGTLAYRRRDGELILPLADFIDTSENRETVDDLLAEEEEATRTSPLRAGMIRVDAWEEILGSSTGYQDQWLIDINFDLEIDTPFVCTTWNGSVHYYVHLSASGGDLDANVIGWSVDRHGGGNPFCVGSVHDRLAAELPDGMDELQQELDSALSPLQTDFVNVRSWYLLPGDGVYPNATTVPNVRHEAALVLIAPELSELIE